MKRRTSLFQAEGTSVSILNTLLEVHQLTAKNILLLQPKVNVCCALPLSNQYIQYQNPHSRPQSPRSFWPVAGIERALAWSNTGSSRFMDFPSNLIAPEYETNALRILRKLGQARALDPCHRPEGSWALGTRMQNQIKRIPYSTQKQTQKKPHQQQQTNNYKLKQREEDDATMKYTLRAIIIHQINCEKSDWLRAFNQFTIARELDMINAISAADNAFIMSSSTSAWLLSPLECSPQKQNG